MVAGWASTCETPATSTPTFPAPLLVIKYFQRPRAVDDDSMEAPETDGHHQRRDLDDQVHKGQGDQVRNSDHDHDGDS